MNEINWWQIIIVFSGIGFVGLVWALYIKYLKVLWLGK